MELLFHESTKRGHLQSSLEIQTEREADATKMTNEMELSTDKRNVGFACA